MGPLDLFWHLANLLAPALGMALIAPTLAKLLWRDALRRAPWAALAAWVGAVGVMVLLGGLVLLGRDGRMATYATLVVASAGVLWWRGAR